MLPRSAAFPDTTREASPSNLRRVAPGIVAAVALVVYARTLLPGMAFADWGEMQTVPHVLGVAHPTGYPTYIILGWLAQLAPIGSVAFRANLLSAVLVSAALAVTVLILLRLGVRPIIAIAVSLALGAVRTVWSAATVAEVNPLHLLFVTLLLHRALVWEEGRRPRDLVIGAFLLGLAFGNHLLIVTVAAFLVPFVLWVGRHEIATRAAILVPAVVAGLLALGTYAYIPIAAAQSPPLPYNRPVTLDSVLWLVGGTQFREQFGFVSSGGPTALAGSIPSLWSLAIDRATPVAVVLGLLGLLDLLRRRRAFGLMCIAILLANIYVWANYLRLEHYLLVPWLLLALGGGHALEVVAQAATRIVDGRWPSRGNAVGVLVGAAALIFAVGLGASNWQSSDRSGDRSAEQFVDTVFDALPPNAAILSMWDASTPLWHAYHVLGRRHDVLVVDDTNVVYEGWGTRERRIAALICERPVYVLRLRDRDLQPLRAAFKLETFITVRVGAGGPSATMTRPVHRVEPRDPAACG